MALDSSSPQALERDLKAVAGRALINPVSSLEGLGAFIGRIYPTTHFLDISRGVFCKSLTLSELSGSFIPLAISVPVLMTLCVLLLKKQDG